MSSNFIKAFAFLGLVLGVIVVDISSEVAARDLLQTKYSRGGNGSGSGVDDNPGCGNYIDSCRGHGPVGGCQHGCCGTKNGGRCSKCCSNVSEVGEFIKS
ncbi:glycine-rich protein DC7.1-like [Cucurbita moschata]|uniref:Glycine-rich protein DC7.1-like n=1 Tax=Cucurbita moschata TaxID=3662 RepID=A0A6J1ERA6_CUCMO|nr:glycine-rich protein DC7.1-like [Cucurbita moschata]